MNIVSFYAPRKDHPYFRDYTPYLMVLEESCRRLGHRHIVISDVDLPGFDTFKTTLPDNLMRAAIAGPLAYLESPLAQEDSVLVGADCVLVNDPAPLFEQEFDVAFTTGDFSDSILNTGAVFVRGGVDAARFWRGALTRMVRWQWGDDQLALAAGVEPTLEHGLYTRSGLKVRFLPVDPYNLAPDHPGHDCSHAIIVHFRGPRKAWMVDYCAKRLGIGKPAEAIAFPNTSNDTILANVAHNSRLPLPWLCEEPPHEYHAVIVGGGPSLNDMFPEIKWRASQGQTIIALNNAAAWLKERGVEADYQLLIDARPENIRFVRDLPAKAYLLASQCHPSVIAEVPRGRVRLFHCIADDIEKHLPEHREALLIGGGVTSGLSAMSVAFTLGYRKLHLYGYDSSDRGNASHAYEQEETNAEKKRVIVWVGDKQFTTQLAMLKQAEGFPQFAQLLADQDCIITVHGDGLLPTIARSMATATLFQPKPSE